MIITIQIKYIIFQKVSIFRISGKKDNPLNIYDALAWADNLDDIYCLKPY